MNGSGVCSSIGRLMILPLRIAANLLAEIDKRRLDLLHAFTRNTNQTLLFFRGELKPAFNEFSPVVAKQVEVRVDSLDKNTEAYCVEFRFLVSTHHNSFLPFELPEAFTSSVGSNGELDARALGVGILNTNGVVSGGCASGYCNYCL